MKNPLIRSGTLAELHAHQGDWVFVDLGFSRRSKTCGFLGVCAARQCDTEAGATKMTFGELTAMVVALAQEDGPPLHLVLEAPLSAAFAADGNPMGRTGEKRENTTRYWYVGLGCSVLVASMYLLRTVADAVPAREVRVFEGLVSFKDGSKRSDHTADVQLLKKVVWSGGTSGGHFLAASPIGAPSGSTMASTMSLLGLDAKPPPIVVGVMP